MSQEISKTIAEIENIVNAIEVIPNSVDLGSIVINDVASILLANSNNLVFLNDKSYLEDLKTTKAAACLITKELAHNLPNTCVAIIVKDPYLAYAKTAQLFHPLPSFKPYISKTSSIDSNAVIGKDCYIGDYVVIYGNVKIGENVYIAPHTVIYDDVVIGNNCYIYAHVSIKKTTIGNNCIIHDGTRIGQDGFGFAPDMTGGGHVKIPQIGRVIIANNVEIGSNTCIDCGAIDNTEIGEGTKIDNLVQIAHNVKVGKHCFIAGCAGIAGSVIIEDYVFIGGRVGISAKVHIKRGTKISPLSGVFKNEVAGDHLMGYPAVNFTTFWKTQAILNKIVADRKKFGL